MINMGFIGLGGMGMHQVQSFAASRRARIVAGSDLSPKAQAAFAKAFPKANVYSDHKQLLKDKKVDAVTVVTPTLFHKTIAIDAMKAGRDVLCEKPMGRTVADCKRMLDVQAKTGRFLMVAHCRRYDSDWGTFAKLYRSDKLGEKVLWRHCAAGPGPRVPWFTDDKLGGGPLIDGAIHNQDFAAWLFGDPQFVHASGVKLNGKVTAVDTASAVVHYANGSQLLLSWSWGSAPTPPLHDVLGPKAAMLFPAAGDPSYYLVAHDGKRRKVAHRPCEMVVNQAKHFADCLEKGATCLSPGTEAIKSVASAEAILKAARTGGGMRKVAW